MNQKQIKPASMYGIDTADGVTREWYKVGRKLFAVTDDGEMLDGEGYPIAGIDEHGNVAGVVHDYDAYRVADAIRALKAVIADIENVVAGMPSPYALAMGDIDHTTH
jgi:hypothetical protein